jgi:hypothetical protein
MPLHGDSLDGPVVTAARHALDVAEVGVILPFVPADSEGEPREAFGRVLPLHAAGGGRLLAADLHHQLTHRVDG